MGRDYRDIVANKKRYPVVSRPFHHACDCLSGNVKKQRQSQVSSLKAKSSERPVAKMGNEEGALRVNTKLKKSDKLPEVDHIIVEEEEKESAVTDSGYFKTEMASSAKPVNQTASSHNLNTTEEVPLLTTDQTP